MSKPDATQKGVSNENTENTDGADDTTVAEKPEAAPQPSARQIAMDAIVVRRETDEDDQLAAQLNDSKSAGREPPPEPTPTYSAPTVLSNGLDKMTVRVKIDGVERDVTVEEMQRQYQKNGAAERRLEEATRLLNEARARDQQREAPPVGVAGDKSKSDSTNTPEDGDSEGKAFLAALFEGDESRALEAFNKAVAGRQQPIRSESELIAQLTPAIKQQLVVDSALERFEANYADVMADPYLEQVAAGFIQTEVDGGMPFAEALDVGGKKTRDWLASKGVKPAPVPTPTIDHNTKLARKAEVDQIPALNKAASTTVEPEQSRSDVIAQMRKARGIE